MESRTLRTRREEGIERVAESTGNLPADKTTLRGLLGRVGELQEWLQRELWSDHSSDSFLLRGARSILQLIALTLSGFRSDRLLLRASALTYVTALSVIPMLGVAFAILRIVGGDETLVNFAIDQLTMVAPDARATVRGYVGNLNFASFGGIGGALVFGTAIFALRHLEQTLNDIWGVKSSRNWARRFADYLAVLVVAPISTGVAVSLATTLQSEPIVAQLLGDPSFARLYGLGLSHLPLAFLFFGFTFLYWFFPDTHVRFSAAALGGAVAAVLFSVARAIYVDFQVGAAAYQAVFGALSAVPLILAWLYACWAVLLLGAEVAFAYQNLSFARREMRVGEVCPAEREAVTLELMVAIAHAFALGEDPPTAERLADVLDEPVRRVRRLLEELEEADLVHSLLPREDEDIRFVPAAPIAELTVGQILRAVRGEPSGVTEAHHRRSLTVSDALRSLEQAWAGVADQTDLGTLVEATRISESGGRPPRVPANDSGVRAVRSAGRGDGDDL